MEGTMTPIAEIMIGTMPLILKLEQYTPSGSHKDRFAQMIARHLRIRGVRQAFMLSSGNAGIGMAHHTQDDDLDLFVITDTLSPREFRDRLRDYRHVQLEVVDKPDEHGSHMAARLEVRERYVAENPGAFEIDQYSDRRIPLAYEQTLFRELDH